MKEKHLPYFAVESALEYNDCPVCFLVIKSIESYFDSLLYENINDISFRTRFRKHNGFCNFHSYKFLNYNDSLAVALTYKDLLIQNINRYNKINNRFSKKTKQKKCMICDMAKDSEKRYLSEIYAYLEDEEFKNKFLKSKGLCMPHYDLFIKDFKSVPKWFNDFNKSNYKIFLQQTETFIESLNFDESKKPIVLTNEEKTIWKKIVKTVSGYEGMPLYDFI